MAGSSDINSCTSITTDLKENSILKYNWRIEKGYDHNQRFKYFWETGLHSDIVIVVGKNKVPIKAHKFILIVGSPIFELNLLKPQFRQMQKGESLIYELPQMGVIEVKLLLKYLYTGECDVSISNALPLFYAANELKIYDLARICESLFDSELDNETALEIFEQLHIYPNEKLEKKALVHICKNASEIIKNDAFLELSLKSIALILEKDEFMIDTELELFLTIVQWGYNECKRQGKTELESVSSNFLRVVLEDLIHLIRFPLMNGKDFAKYVVSKNILTSDEVQTLLIYFLMEESKERNGSPHGVFNSNPRARLESSCSFEDPKVMAGVQENLIEQAEDVCTKDERKSKKQSWKKLEKRLVK